MKLQELIREITPVSQEAAALCRKKWDGIAKPLGSLGKLEQLVEKIAAVCGNSEIDIRKKCVLVFCADNGVVNNGVAQSDHTVTTAIARSLLRGTASVCAMARACGAEVRAFDVGMAETVPVLPCRKTANGTMDMTKGPAMTSAQAEDAILFGMEQVRIAKEQGFTLLAAGEAGIGNTTTAAAVSAVLLGLSATQAVGRGSGLSDEGLRNKQHAVETAIAVNKPDAANPLDVLAKVGGFDIAAMTGAFLGAAVYKVPIVIDGLISSAAALCAVRLCPLVKEYLLPSHLTAEPAGTAIMEELGLSPILHASLRLGEGTGAAALFPILDQAVSVYESAATFADISVEPYRRKPC